ncbi:MAG: hypothetical protein VB853_03985, partial [Pirellulales bacterium]
IETLTDVAPGGVGVTGAGTQADPWVVTFTAATRDAGDDYLKLAHHYDLQSYLGSLTQRDDTRVFDRFYRLGDAEASYLFENGQPALVSGSTVMEQLDHNQVQLLALDSLQTAGGVLWYGNEGVAVNPGDSAAVVQDRLLRLATVADVQVSGSGTTADPWQFRFAEAAKESNDDFLVLKLSLLAHQALDPATVYSRGGISTISNGSPLIPAVTPQNEVQRLALGSATGGQFTLQLGGEAPVSVDVGANDAATAESIRSQLSGVADVTVAVAVGGAGVFNVTFTAPAATNVETLLLAAGALVTAGGGPVNDASVSVTQEGRAAVAEVPATNEVQRIGLNSLTVGSLFTLAVEGQSPVTVTVGGDDDATAADIQLQLRTIPGLADVEATAAAAGSGFFDVDFGAATDQAELILAAPGGGEVRLPIHDRQHVMLPANAVQVEFGYGSDTAVFNVDGSASALEVGLDDLVNDVAVSTRATTDDPYEIAVIDGDSKAGLMLVGTPAVGDTWKLELRDATGPLAISTHVVAEVAGVLQSLADIAAGLAGGITAPADYTIEVDADNDRRLVATSSTNNWFELVQTTV